MAAFDQVSCITQKSEKGNDYKAQSVYICTKKGKVTNFHLKTTHTLRPQNTGLSVLLYLVISSYLDGGAYHNFTGII